MIARNRSRVSLAGCLLAASAVCAQAPAPTPAAPDEAIEWRYVVAPGDNLYTLARSYLAPDISWQRLQRLNAVADPLRLEPGRELRMPFSWLRADPSVATVVFVAGAVRREGAAGGSALSIGDELRAGDTVATDPAATLTLRLADASRVLVAGGSRLRIDSLLRIGPRKALDARLRLDAGEAESRIRSPSDALAEPPPAAPTRYEIRTPALTLGVRGTEFRVRVDADAQRTRAEVTQGRVGAGRPGGEARRFEPIEAGFGRVADAAGLGPAQPLLGAPQLDALATLHERVPLAFAWPALAGAAGYRAQIAADAGFEQRLLDATSAEPMVRWADLPDGRYVLRVRARDAAGLEGRSAQIAFALKARPEPPLPIAPRRDARVYGDAVELAWTRAGGAQRYRVQIAADADPGFAAPLVDRDNQVDPRLQNALAPGLYRWRLASIASGDDRGPFGDAGRFELRAVPPAVRLDPPRTRGEQFVFEWPARSPGEAYDIQLARNADFAQPALERHLERPELALDGLESGAWFLRIRTIEADGFVGPWGTSQQFEVPHSRWWWLLPGALLLLLL